MSFLDGFRRKKLDETLQYGDRGTWKNGGPPRIKRRPEVAKIDTDTQTEKE